MGYEEEGGMGPWGTDSDVVSPVNMQKTRVVCLAG